MIYYSIHTDRYVYASAAMDKAYTTLLILFYILLTITHSFAQSICNKDATLCWKCSDKKGSDSSSGTYKENLKALLLSFPTKDPNEVGYYNISQGSGPNDKVTVIALCRGDLANDPKSCQSCLNDTATWVLENCPNQKEAIIWGEKCMVQYSNDSKFHLMDKDPLQVLESPNKYTDVGAEIFDARLKSLLQDLTTNASSSVAKYASGSVNVTMSQSIYSLVQCIPTLSPKECSDCLVESSSMIPARCCAGVDGARVLKPACTLRYEKGIFYNVDTTSQVPPTTTTATSRTDGKKNGVLWSVIGVLAVLSSMLVHGFP